jgi:hypothetical protein
MGTTTLDNAPQATVPTKVSENERCDACNARAAWLVTFDASELAWCNHHYNRFLPKFDGKKVVKLTDDAS